MKRKHVLQFRHAEDMAARLLKVGSACVCLLIAMRLMQGFFFSNTMVYFKVSTLNKHRNK